MASFIGRRAGAAALGLLALAALPAAAQELLAVPAEAQEATAVPAATAAGATAEVVGYRIDVTGESFEPFYARCRVVDDQHFSIKRFRSTIPYSVQFPVDAVDCKVTLLDPLAAMQVAVVEERANGEEVVLGTVANPYNRQSVIARSAGYWGSAGAAPWWPEWAHEFPPGD